MISTCRRVFFIGLMSLGLIILFVVQGSAKIDPKTIEGLWLFDDGQGNVVKDSSGKGLDGKITGNPKWVAGKFKGALEFDGKSYVRIPDHKNPRKAITVTIWAKSPTPTWNEHGWLFEKRDAYIVHPNANTTNVAFCVVNGAPWNRPKTWDAGAVGPKDITVWHMYTCTFDSATGKWSIYIDAELASSMDLDKAEIAEDTGPVHIGWDDCCGGTRFGLGTVDEAAVFNVALSKDDIRAIYTSGLQPTVLTAVNRTDKLATTWGDIKVND